MLDFAEVNIKDKKTFDGFFKDSNPQASEYSFTNIFMWRNYYKFRFAVEDNILYIISVPEVESPFAFVPLGCKGNQAMAESLGKLKTFFNEKGWTLQFKRVWEEKLEEFKQFDTWKLDIVPDRNSSDYVYLSEDLVKLSGKKFDGKRNHINNFKKHHEFEYVPLGKEQIEDCVRITHEWCAERSCRDHRGLYCEKLANLELLNNFEELGCEGALIRVDGRFDAFTTGEMLNSDTAVIHIEKAKSSINGLYTFINQQFCENVWQNRALLINREQDLGIEGIRKAKLSYNPVKMINKYSVTVNN